MSAQTCVECRLTLDLSKFPPRHNAQYDDLPAMNEVWRQPRCRECNKLYQRRRHLFRRRLLPLAKEHGVVVRQRPRSVFRVVEVDSENGRTSLRGLQQIAREFNDSLPDDRCDVATHGVTVVLMRQPNVLDIIQATLFPDEELDGQAIRIDTNPASSAD